MLDIHCSRHVSRKHVEAVEYTKDRAYFSAESMEKEAEEEDIPE